MSQYYQFAEELIDKSQSLSEASNQKKLLDVAWNRHDFCKVKLLNERQLKILYFFSYLSLVCVAHFTKLFYLEVGLSVSQICILQCIFYLSRYVGCSTIIYIDELFAQSGAHAANHILQNLRMIMISSILLSTGVWMLLVLPNFQTFGALLPLVFLGSIFISTSHGFLDIVTEDTITKSKTNIDYSNIRFICLLAWGIGGILIGAKVSAIHTYSIFYAFAAFQAMFLLCIICWFPERYVHDPHVSPNATFMMCANKNLFNVYLLFFLFGMVNALPEILMIHLMLVFKIDGLFLGILIASMAFGEMFGCLLISMCSCKKVSLAISAILAFGFTAARLSYWNELKSKYIFLGSEFIEYSLVTIFWTSALHQVKFMVDFEKRKTLLRDLQGVWHFQSLAVGVLFYGVLYQSAGATGCFSLASTVTLGLLVYYFIVFHACFAKVVDFNSDDSLLETGRATSDFETQVVDTVDANHSIEEFGATSLDDEVDSVQEDEDTPIDDDLPTL